ncbi:DnaJ domain-containing protein, partial [Baffinella frigidus]
MRRTTRCAWRRPALLLLAGLATLLVTAAAAEASEKKDQTKEAEKPAEKVSEGSSSEEDTGEEIPCDFVEKMDHYERLGVKKGASAADIKKAYRKTSLIYHPDKNKGKAKACAQKNFMASAKAYEILSNKDSRKQYDTFGDLE